MKTKNSNPAKFLVGKSVDPLIFLYFQINHLKQLYRQGWLSERRDIPEKQCESVADHVFGVSILALFVCDLYFPKLDSLKVLMMCLIHELCEVINGDPRSPQTRKGKLSKHIAERAAIIELLKHFPNFEKYLILWEEYEEGKTREARFVKQIDKLEMAFQAKIYSLQHGKNLQDFYDFVRPLLKSKRLKRILNQIESI